MRKLRLENLKNDLIIRELEQNGDREKLGEFYEKLAQKAKAEEERRLDKQVSELPEATRRKLLSEVKKATEKALKA